MRVGYVVEVLDCYPKTAYKIKEIEKIIDETPILTEGLMKLASFMESYYIVSPGEVYSSILPEFLKPLKRARRNTVQPAEKIKKTTPFLLYGQQNEALKELLLKSSLKQSHKFLLHGVTDSGKTEVYQQLISSLINSSKQVIMLVPEISITSQMISSFKERFNQEKIAVWHSRISVAEKMDCINRIRNGGIDILIGPRSAVFAPFPNLGAIIVDEEQDATYKENNSPYYDARWIAEKRCEIENAILLLSSATPSIETFYRAAKNIIHYIGISQKIHIKEFPEVVIVNMKEERLLRSQSSIFSKYLLEEIEKTLKKKKQIIIFINRRGYAPFVICKNCGENVKCKNCNVSLIYHSDKMFDNLICHLCGYKKSMGDDCLFCGGRVFKYVSWGTQRVEQALQKIFSDARIIRMDNDTTSKKGTAENIFRKFKNKKYDIMVGTQILTKGWDFPDVSLVGAINSDASLMMPDFRASEKTYSILKQLGGRTGRGKDRGKFIIQAFNIDHYSIRLLFEKDFSKFYEKEIKIREESDFPPFSKLINIISSHKNEKTAKKNIEKFSNYLTEKVKDVTILGPAPALRYKVRNNFRWQILLKHKNEKIKKILREMLVKKTFARHLKIDIDPQDML